MYNNNNNKSKIKNTSTFYFNCDVREIRFQLVSTQFLLIDLYYFYFFGVYLSHIVSVLI